MAKNNSTLFVIGGAALAATLLMGSKKSSAASPKPIILTPVSIQIKNDEKATNYIFDIVQKYARSLKDIHEFSYIDVVGKLIQSLSADTYAKYSKQMLTKDGILIVAYLSISVQNAFKLSYFGEFSKIEQGKEPKELLNDPDYLAWEEFRDKINPEALEKFNTFIGYKAEWANDVFNVTEIIQKNDKYPV